MFKLYNFHNNNKIEIIQEKGIYNVNELGEYEFEYNGTLINKEIFLEDIPIERNWYDVYRNSIKSQRHRFFQDFFGYSTLTINNENILINIRIEKLKLNEIEDIFIYLWEKDEKLFNIFVSKNTFNLYFNKDGKNETSFKFLNLLEKFHEVFENLLPYFKKNPHTMTLSDFKLMDYSQKNITTHSIDWIVNNLDCLNTNPRYNTNPDSIKINNNYALIDKIETELKINTLKTYENQIILGIFLNVLHKIFLLEIEINQYIDKTKENSENKAFYDIKDLKRIPFLKLRERIKVIETKIKKLYLNYKSFFKHIIPRFEKPTLTAAFSNIFHYKKAYLLIQQMWDSKYNLFSEYHLMNIRKLSQLYEIYNLYLIIDTLKNKLNTENYSISMRSNRDDDIINIISFSNPEMQINLYYEQKYYSHNEGNAVKLRRIDSTKGSYYKPDYIIEFINKNQTNYYIFDAKYSNLETIKNNFFNNTFFKYILNTGIAEEEYKKIELLCLLYPGDKSENIVVSDKFKPTVKIIASKPNKENDLIDFIDEIVKIEITQFENFASMLN